MIQNDIRSLKDSKDNIITRIDGLQYDVEDVQEGAVAQHNELYMCQDQIQLLSNIVIGYEEKIQQLNDEVVNMEARSMRSELVIFGIS